MRRTATTVLALVVLVVAAARLPADDKPVAPIDGKKLVGRWEGEAVLFKTEDGKGKTLIEFTADGVIKLKVTSGSFTITNEGKYTLEGNKLTILTKPGKTDEAKDVATITKLTDTELEWLNKDKKTETWKRVKEEKK